MQIAYHYDDETAIGSSNTELLCDCSMYSQLGIEHQVKRTLIRGEVNKHNVIVFHKWVSKHKLINLGKATDAYF